MSIKLVTEDRYQGDGRAFGTSSNPIKKLITCLSTDGSLPESYEDIQGLNECAFAPGSICIDTNGNKKYFFDGTEWKEWS